MKKTKLLGFICIILIAVIVVLLAIFVLPMLKENGLNPGSKGSSSGTEKLDVSEEQAKKYINEFGLLENVTCKKTVLDFTYTDDFKAIISIKQAMDKYGIEKECSDVFDESQKVDNSSYKKDNYCFVSQKTKVVDYDKVNSIYKNLYGSDLSKKSVNGLTVANMFYYFYDYIDSINSFALTSGNGLGGSCGPNYSITEYKDYSLDDNLLKINLYHGYGNLDFMDDNNYFVYFGNDKIVCEKSDQCASQILEKHKNELDIYELLLEYKDGNFIFKNLSKKLG